MTPSRRRFLHLLGAAAGATVPARVFGRAPAIVRRESALPAVDYGVASGDVGLDRAIVWAHVDRPSRMVVEWANTEKFERVHRVRGPVATPDTGLTARVALNGLPSGQHVHYRIHFEEEGGKAVGHPVAGHFHTGSSRPTNVRLAWSADTVGQGWGIDKARGGMRLFETMRRTAPDLFINLGDTIYADQPLKEEVTLDDGTAWRNLVTPAKAKVAETLDEFRGCHLYNRLDEHYARFAAEVGQVTLWDDHEVRDNWFPTQDLARDERYTEKSVQVLSERARRAFLEHYPIPLLPNGTGRIYRTIPFGPLVEIFALDMRQYRGPNSDNVQPTLTAEAAFMGTGQVRWLQDKLAASKATWKVIAADMPLGVVVAHAPHQHEAVANGEPGAPLGRELEIAGLLKFIKDRAIHNVVWITADVHYCAAHHFAPERAGFTDFAPFWEFVAGPAHAGTFLPGELDPTFGPELKFSGVPKDMKPNRPPSDGYQFYGTMSVDARSRAMTVRLHNLAGDAIYTNDLTPVL